MRALPVLLLLPALAVGCKPDCKEGFSESESGACLRNHYGDPHGGGITVDDTGADDTGSSGTSAPACSLTGGQFGTDAGGVNFYEVELTCADPEDDMVGGKVHVLWDGSDNSDHTIVEGVEETEDYANAWLSGSDLWFWLEGIDPGDYAYNVTVFDAAGHVSNPLDLQASATPQ